MAAQPVCSELDNWSFARMPVAVIAQSDVLPAALVQQVGLTSAKASGALSPQSSEDIAGPSLKPQSSGWFKRHQRRKSASWAGSVVDLLRDDSLPAGAPPPLPPKPQRDASVAKVEPPTPNAASTPVSANTAVSVLKHSPKPRVRSRSLTGLDTAFNEMRREDEAQQQPQRPRTASDAAKRRPSLPSGDSRPESPRHKLTAKMGTLFRSKKKDSKLEKSGTISSPSEVARQLQPSGSSVGPSEEKRTKRDFLARFLHRRPKASDLEERSIIVDSAERAMRRAKSMQRIQTLLERRLSTRPPVAKHVLFSTANGRSSDVESVSEVPVGLSACVDNLMTRALDDEGLFRVSGSKARIASLREALDSGAEIDLAAEDVHTVACALKQYCRDMLIPVIPNSLKPLLMLSKDIPAAGADLPLRLAFVRGLLRRLPPMHWYLLTRLVALLARVADRSDQNRMPTSNLAIVFGPVLMPSPADMGLLAVTESHTTAELASLMITHRDELFSETEDDELTPFVAGCDHVGTESSELSFRAGHVLIAFDSASNSDGASRFCFNQDTECFGRVLLSALSPAPIPVLEAEPSREPSLLFPKVSAKRDKDFVVFRSWVQTAGDNDGQPTDLVQAPVQ